MGEEIAAQIGDDALAERHHEVVAGARGEREHRDDADHGDEIKADEPGVGLGEAVVDHPPDRDRHDERRRRGDDQRCDRRDDPAAIVPGVGQQGPQGAQRSARRRLWRRGGG